MRTTPPFGIVLPAGGSVVSHMNNRVQAAPLGVGRFLGGPDGIASGLQRVHSYFPQFGPMREFRCPSLFRDHPSSVFAGTKNGGPQKPLTETQPMSTLDIILHRTPEQVAEDERIDLQILHEFIATSKSPEEINREMVEMILRHPISAIPHEFSLGEGCRFLFPRIAELALEYGGLQFAMPFKYENPFALHNIFAASNDMTWDFISHVMDMKLEGEPWLKYFCMFLASCILRDSMRHEEIDVAAYRDVAASIFAKGLRERNIANVDMAFYGFERWARAYQRSVDRYFEGAFDGAMLDDVVVENPEFGITRYVWQGDGLFGHFRSFALEALGRNYKTEFPRGGFDLRDVHPIHSLADFNPDHEKRQQMFVEKYIKLQGLVSRYGVEAREAIINKCLRIPSASGVAEPIGVLRFSDGSQYLMQGHHRMAALVVAVQRGVIPANWLDGLPLDLMTYTGDVPESYLKLMITGGADLTWDDLFPVATWGSG